MKGNSIELGINIITVLASVMILAIAVNFGVTLDEKAKVETLPTVEKRVESALLMLSGVKKGQVELDLDDDYGLQEKENKVLLNFTAEGVFVPSSDTFSEKQIESSANFRLKESGKSRYLCINKKPDKMLLYPGEC